jgi:peptidoglycan/xylan/chitin deacetylase (PgdA/CDA1 family)
MTPRWFDFFFPHWIWHLPLGSRQVALTFDDGPGATSTPALLDLLRDLNVQVTFFLIGEKIEGNSALLARAASEGHVLANHGYYHENHAWYPRWKLKESIEKTEKALTDSGVQPARLFRPPYGAFLPRMSRELRHLGYSGVIWNAHLRDWKSQSTEALKNRASRSLSDGTIILLHDKEGIRGDVTRGIIPFLVEQGRKQGLQFVTLSEEVVA